MAESGETAQGREKLNEVKTFPVPFAFKEIRENLSTNSNTLSKTSKEQLINRAFKFHSEGNISAAIKHYQHFINQGFKDYRVFSNYGGILKDLGKLKEAELSTRKAIALNPKFPLAHSNLGSILKDLGKLKEAELSTRKAIALNPKFALAHSNLGSILKDLGKLKEAELSCRKAIAFNPNIAESHYNLGCILKDLGNLKDAKVSIQKAIALNPNYAKAYFSLSTLQYSNKSKIWKDQLFSRSILNNKLPKEQIDIYFARANIFHKEKKYENSSKYLQLANNLKLNLNTSNADIVINKSRTLLIESDKKEINTKEYTSFPENIFIVGMPRSGSTLVESILSMNSNINDLGEANILEQAFQESKKIDQTLTLFELYLQKVNELKNPSQITTNKNLYNYQYAGIIINLIPNAKIIHCYRNPLDNILSIYRANFIKNNEYASSIIDCTRVYLDQEEIMKDYKNRFRSKIYDLNYDILVSNPNQEIKSLISWLGWKWEHLYLSPHLNPRSVSTASNVQVRSPINSKSIGGWKNYKEMLKPAIEILSQNDRYQDLIS